MNLRLSLALIFLIFGIGRVSAATSQPFHGTPVLLPAVIQAEDYDTGGSESAFHDPSSSRPGLTPTPWGEGDGIYRQDGGDTFGPHSPGGLCSISQLSQGDWYQYTINAPTSGRYRIIFRYGTATVGQVQASRDGIPITDVVDLPFVGYDSPGTATAEILLRSGPQILRLTFFSAFSFGSCYLDSFELVPIATSVVVDNRDVGATRLGTWTNSTFTPGYWGVDYLSATPGSSSVTFRPQLPQTGIYDIYLHYPASVGRGTAPVTVVYGDGTRTFPTATNQRSIGPLGYPLGDFFFHAGSTGAVTIAAAPTGATAADAVEFVLRTSGVPSSDIIIDNSDPTRVSTSGPWARSSFNANLPSPPTFYGADFLAAPRGATGFVTFVPNLPRAGRYETYIWYPSHAQRDVAQIDIDHGDGTITTTNIDERAGGGRWRLLGEFAYAGGSLSSVRVRAIGNPGRIAADAVRFLEVPQPPPRILIIDNRDLARVTPIGPWTIGTKAINSYGGNYLWTAPLPGRSVSFRPNFSRPGRFRVEVYMPFFGEFAPAVSWSLDPGNGSGLLTTSVQMGGAGGEAGWTAWVTAPNGYLEVDLPAGAAPSVSISTDGNTAPLFAADAVRFIEVPMSTPPTGSG